MKRKLIAGVLVVALLLFIFLCPVVPASSPYPGIIEIAGHITYYHYNKSISGIFLPYGTSLWNGKYYLNPAPFWGITA
ncbi:MAG: hypothetical protein ACYCT2_08620 [Thermoplasmataceae archaeon]